DKRIDGRRLVAGRRVRLIKLEGAVGKLDESRRVAVHTSLLILDTVRVNPLLSHYCFQFSTHLFSHKMNSLFESVELAPRDPILGLNEQYNADTRPGKVNLGVGVYYD